jgi:hypothetical protein
MIGPAFDVVYVFASSCVALFLVTGGIVGHALKPLGLASRLASIVVGLLMIAPLDKIGSYALELGVSAFGLIMLVAFVAAGRGGGASATETEQA